jgi:hypothetical protein
MEMATTPGNAAGQHPSDLLAAFALDALTHDERTRVAAHLVGCAACRSEVSRFQQVTAVLPLANPVPDAPRPELRDRILREATAVRQARQRPAPRRPAPRLLRLPSVAGWLAAAALFLISLGLGALDLTLAQRPQALQQPGTVALAATADAPGASGRVLVDGGRPSILTVDNLPPPGTGLVYEAWVIGPGGPEPAGTFVTTSDGRGALALTRPAQSGEVVAVTAEPTPGRASPSGKILLKGTI